jgi:hypothetical protein
MSTLLEKITFIIKMVKYKHITPKVIINENEEVVVLLEDDHHYNYKVNLGENLNLKNDFDIL